MATEEVVEQKGLKEGALGLVSSVVIGVASTAPGYSLAAVLTLVVAAVGVQAPAVLILAFLPMLFIAASYYYMNRADPDCGTTFSWVTRAMGPWAGWIGGWAIVIADIIVMANLAQIAGLYGFLLFGWQSAADSTLAVTVVGVLWIVVMTAICVYGIELSARTQVGLLGAEILTLVLFAVVALAKVATGDAPDGSVSPDLGWFSPFAIDSTDGLVAGLLVAVFIYWGWDSTVCVNEETSDSGTTPGKAAVASTVILVGIYVLVAVAAIAFAGPEKIAKDDSGDALGLLGTAVLGSPLDKLVIIAVLTSAAASTQTTILPTARTSLVDGARGGDARDPRPHPPALPDSGRVDGPHGHVLDRLVCRADAGQREHPLRLDRRARADDRLLLRDHRLRVRDLLPPRADQQRQELPLGRGRAGDRRRGVDVAVRQVVHRPLQAGELGVGRLLVRARAAARDRARLDAVRCRADVLVVGRRAPRLLPPTPEVAEPGALEAPPPQVAETAGIA